MPSLIKLLPYTLRHLKWITNKILLYTAQVTLLNIMWWAEWEGSLHGIFQARRSGLPFPSPGELPSPGIKPTSLVSPALAVGFFTTESPGQRGIPDQRSNLGPLASGVLATRPQGRPIPHFLQVALDVMALRLC